MQIFAVVGMLEEEQEEIVKLAHSLVGENNTFAVEGALFVSTEEAYLTQDLAKKLGIGDRDHKYTGVVINAKFNWGFHDKYLWEWMEAKSGDGNGR